MRPGMSGRGTLMFSQMLIGLYQEHVMKGRSVCSHIVYNCSIKNTVILADSLLC